MICLKDRLLASKKPVVLYGMGDGADKILALLESYGIRVSGVFASDGFVRHQKYRDFTVKSYDEICGEFDDFVILVAFASSLPDVMDRVKELSAKRELYIPDVPVAGDNIFDEAFFRNHREELNNARSLLCDDESRRVFDLTVEYKLTGSREPLFASESSEEDVFSHILHPREYSTALDLGAYTGDTAKRLLRFSPEIEKIIALEPDPKSYGRLCAAADEFSVIEPHNVAAWDESVTLEFKKGGSRSSKVGVGAKTIAVSASRADDVLSGRSVDYIKYDVEGAELRAINGTSRAIAEYSPELCVSLYHRSEDIFVLPRRIHEINPNYNFYLRRYPYFPAWDLNLFAVRK